MIEARRSPDGSRPFVIVPPPGWSCVREQRVEKGAPYEVPAFCPAHRPNARAVLSRSIEEIADRTQARTGADARDMAARLARCARAIERWAVVPPTDEQLAAMNALVAELRDEAGLPPGPVTGVRRAARRPTD
jgi:hypothetical protein